MIGIKIVPRNFRECPHYIDAETEKKISGKPMSCERMPVHRFNDSKCTGCPILGNCCDYYRGNRRTSAAYKFCPICGNDMNVPKDSPPPGGKDAVSGE